MNAAFCLYFSCFLLFYRAGKPQKLSGAFLHSAQSAPDRIREPAQKPFANFFGKQYIFLLLLQAF